jgi:hypothetical protein
MLISDFMLRTFMIIANELLNSKVTPSIKNKNG